MSKAFIDKENRLKENMQREEQIRQQALNTAQSQLAQLKNRWNLETSDEDFRKKLEELSNLRTQYEDLLKQFTQERQKLQLNVRNNQLNKFLSQFLIEDCDIPRIGASRKAALRSYGIETAVDIERNKITQIFGFGKQRARELVDWRNSLERRFVFDPSKGIDPTDIAALNQRFALKRKQLEGVLLAGTEQLTQIRQQILQRRAQLLTEIEKVAQQVKQAEADLTVFN